MEPLTKALSQIRELWGKLGGRARAGLMAVVVLGLVAAGIVAINSRVPRWYTSYTISPPTVRRTDTRDGWSGQNPAAARSPRHSISE